MASKLKSPATIQVIRAGKTNEYQLADAKDWGIIFDDVLEIRSSDGCTYYWPLLSITLWKVREHAP